MNLRRDRQTAGTTPPVRDGATVTGLTMSEVARSLRRARTRQGLSLADVSTRTGVPVDHLQAAETGSLHLPDQLAALRTVRRYADFLGLPGDRYALALLEHWPTKPGHASRPAMRPPPVEDPPATGVLLSGRQVPVVVPVAAPPDTAPPDAAPPDAAPTSGPAGASEGPATAANADPVADPVTAAVPAVEAMPWTGLHSYRDTGVGPVLSPAAGSTRRRNPRPLKILVGITAAAVVVGGAGLVIAHQEPRWLHDLGIGHAAGTTSAATSAGRGGKAHTPTSGVPAGSHGTTGTKTATATATVQTDPASPASATVRIPSPRYSVTVSAVGPCWVDVTTATSPTPIFAGVLTAGEHKTFTGTPGLRVQLGSAAGRLSATSGSRPLLATFVPPVAPFTATFAG